MQYSRRKAREGRPGQGEGILRITDCELRIKSNNPQSVIFILYTTISSDEIKDIPVYYGPTGKRGMRGVEAALLGLVEELPFEQTSDSRIFTTVVDGRTPIMVDVHFIIDDSQFEISPARLFVLLYAG